MASPRSALPPGMAAEQTAAVYPRLRWMGSKYRLLPHLAETFADVGGHVAVDAFSGSGVVGYLLKLQGFEVHSNDYLGFPGVVADAVIANGTTLLTDAEVDRVLGPSADGRSFVRDTYEGRFFTPDDLDFLDSAWSHIACLTGPARSIAIAALCLSAARKQPRGVFTISGDLRHYDDGRRDLRLSLRDHFVERVADYNRAVVPGPAATVSTREVSDLVAPPGAVVYLDPPYAPPRDDNDYIKRHHFLEGLSRYWEGDDLMWETKTRKLPKQVTPFSTRRTIVAAFAALFRQFAEHTLVLSYGSNALPDLPTLVALLHEVKDDVEVRSFPHRYAYGTHAAATRRTVEEHIIVAR